MEKQKNSFYQIAYLNYKTVAGHRFDLVFGGIKGEGYIYWKGNQPITVQTSAKAVALPFAVTTHRIAVYPQESAKIMAYLKSTGKRSINN